MSTKEAIMEAIVDLPEDATMQEALMKIYIRYRLERGLQQIEAGEVYDVDEVFRDSDKWITK